MSSLPLAALAAPAGFCRDARFSAPDAATEQADPVQRAWDEGFAAGHAEAQAAAALHAAEQETVLNRLQYSLGRIDAELQDRLRERLFATVAALCEATIAPLALDAAALGRRVEQACAILADGDGKPTLRLHPEDIILVKKLVPQAVDLRPDSSLERGTLVAESGDGGIEDGPALWRRAIAEALAPC